MTVCNWAAAARVGLMPGDDRLSMGDQVGVGVVVVVVVVVVVHGSSIVVVVNGSSPTCQRRAPPDEAGAEAKNRLSMSDKVAWHVMVRHGIVWMVRYDMVW